MCLKEAGLPLGFYREYYFHLGSFSPHACNPQNTSMYLDKSRCHAQAKTIVILFGSKKWDNYVCQSILINPAAGIYYRYSCRRSVISRILHSCLKRHLAACFRGFQGVLKNMPDRWLQEIRIRLYHGAVYRRMNLAVESDSFFFK